MLIDRQIANGTSDTPLGGISPVAGAALCSGKFRDENTETRSCFDRIAPTRTEDWKQALTLAELVRRLTLRV